MGKIENNDRDRMKKCNRIDDEENEIDSMMAEDTQSMAS